MDENIIEEDYDEELGEGKSFDSDPYTLSRKLIFFPSFFVHTEEDDYNDEEVMTCTIFRIKNKS